MKLILSITTAFLLSVCSWAQTGLVGFANYSDFGLHGTTGGMGGEIVHVCSREDFERYVGSPIPYIIILDTDLKGHYNYHTSPKQKHDVVSVAGDKTIIGGGAGACLDSLGLDVKDASNLSISVRHPTL